MPHSSAERLRVGTVGWCRPAWCDAYYPQDLPPDWRLAYLANDADCLWLAAGDLAGLDVDAFAGAWAEVDAGLEVYCDAPADAVPGALADVVGDALVRLQPASDGAADGLWHDAGGERRVARVTLDAFDLRGLRARIERLPSSATALCLDGPAGSPGRLRDLRTLLDLLGR